jgi:NAD(P)-dependent dehydrogenase (short-subunit alcohol dehydrogenase family)
VSEQVRTAIVTGSARGIGAAVARRLAADGFGVAVVDLDEAACAGTVDAITAQSPDAETVTVIADVSKEADVQNYVDAAVAAFGPIDGFFNNAGIEGKQNLTENFTADEFDKVVSINLRGVFLGMEKVLAVMRKQGSGSVVNTASVGGIRGVGNQSGYAAAKHGVVGLTRNSAVEYGRFGVRINAIAPGAIWTPMVENSMKQLDPDDPRGAAEQFIQGNPTLRYGEAHEIAAVVAFLLSEDSSYVNATVIPIDGGQSAKY